MQSIAITSTGLAAGKRIAVQMFAQEGTIAGSVKGSGTVKVGIWKFGDKVRPARSVPLKPGEMGVPPAIGTPDGFPLRADKSAFLRLEEVKASVVGTLHRPSFNSSLDLIANVRDACLFQSYAGVS